MTTACDITRASLNSSRKAAAAICLAPGNARSCSAHPGCAQRPYIITNPAARVRNRAHNFWSGSRKTSNASNYITWPYRSDVNRQFCFGTSWAPSSYGGGGGVLQTRASPRMLINCCLRRRLAISELWECYECIGVRTHSICTLTGCFCRTVVAKANWKWKSLSSVILARVGCLHNSIHPGTYCHARLFRLCVIFFKNLDQDTETTLIRSNISIQCLF